MTFLPDSKGSNSRSSPSALSHPFSLAYQTKNVSCSPSHAVRRGTRGLANAAEPLRHHATTKNRANRPAKGLRTFMISSSTHENVRFPGFRTEPLPTEQPRTFAMTIPQKKGSGNAGRSSEFFGVKRIMEQAPHHHARHGGRSGIRAIPLLLLRKRHIFRDRIRTVSAARRAPGGRKGPPKRSRRALSYATNVPAIRFRVSCEGVHGTFEFTGRHAQSGRQDAS